MSSINTVSNTNNLSGLQQLSPSSQRIAGGKGDGDSDGGKETRGVGKSNFMNAITQALGQSLSGTSGTSSSASSSSSSTSPTTPDPQAALQAFVQNLFSSLGQMASGIQTTGSDSDGDSDGSKSVSGAGKAGANMSANIQNLLQQLSASGQSSSTGTTSSATDPLSALNSSFQNLVTAMNSSQGQTAAAANAPTLQSFLQNLMQDMSGGQNISGAIVSTHA
ncbi:MAG: hypothetical protein HKM01_08925 [Gallionella sp.]|nr:hypothetical protein [Gallionella sp.]